MRIDIHQFCGSQMLFFCRAQCVSNDQDIHVVKYGARIHVCTGCWLNYHWNRSPRKKCKYDLIENVECVLCHLVILICHTIALFLRNNLNTSSLWLCWAAEYITLGVGAREIQKRRTTQNSKRKTKNTKTQMHIHVCIEC